MRLLNRLAMLVLFVALIIGFEPLRLHAQTDPCSGTVTNATLDDSQKFGIGLCIPLVDSKDNPITPTDIKVAIDTGAQQTVPVIRQGTTTFTVNGKPSGYFETSRTALGPAAVGQHSAVTKYVYTSALTTGPQEGAGPTIPFGVNATSGQALAAASGRIVR